MLGHLKEMIEWARSDQPGLLPDVTPLLTGFSDLNAESITQYSTWESETEMLLGRLAASCSSQSVMPPSRLTDDALCGALVSDQLKVLLLEDIPLLRAIVPDAVVIFSVAVVELLVKWTSTTVLGSFTHKEVKGASDVAAGALPTAKLKTNVARAHVYGSVCSIAVAFFAVVRTVCTQGVLDKHRSRTRLETSSFGYIKSTHHPSLPTDLPIPIWQGSIMFAMCAATLSLEPCIVKPPASTTTNVCASRVNHSLSINIVSLVFGDAVLCYAHH